MEKKVDVKKEDVISNNEIIVKILKEPTSKDIKVSNIEKVFNLSNPLKESVYEILELNMKSYNNDYIYLLEYHLKKITGYDILYLISNSYDIEYNSKINFNFNIYKKYLIGDFKNFKNDIDRESLSSLFLFFSNIIEIKNNNEKITQNRTQNILSYLLNENIRSENTMYLISKIFTLCDELNIDDNNYKDKLEKLKPHLFSCDNFMMSLILCKSTNEKIYESIIKNFTEKEHEFYIETLINNKNIRNFCAKYIDDEILFSIIENSMKNKPEEKIIETKHDFCFQEINSESFNLIAKRFKNFIFDKNIYSDSYIKLGKKNFTKKIKSSLMKNSEDENLLLDVIMDKLYFENQILTYEDFIDFQNILPSIESIKFKDYVVSLLKNNMNLFLNNENDFFYYVTSKSNEKCNFLEHIITYNKNKEEVLMKLISYCQKKKIRKQFIANCENKLFNLSIKNEDYINDKKIIKKL